MKKMGGEIHKTETASRPLCVVDLDEKEATWMRKELGEMMETNKIADKRIYRGNLVTLIIQKCQNQRGKVLKVWKVNRHGWQMVLVPEDIGGTGWNKLYGALQLTTNKAPPPNRQITMAQNLLPKEWDMAVVIFRASAKYQWELVEQAVAVVLNKNISLSLIGDDRAILICNSMVERDSILEEGKTAGGQMIERVVKWKPECHWEDLKFECNENWIMVEGLLLNMWNRFAFEMIGSHFGGLLQVEESTRRKSHMGQAFLKVKGSDRDFFPKNLRGNQ